MSKYIRTTIGIILVIVGLIGIVVGLQASKENPLEGFEVVPAIVTGSRTVEVVWETYALVGYNWGFKI